MSTSYDFSGDLSGLSLGAAYSSSDRTNAQEGASQNNALYAGGKTAEAWTIGAKYDANNVYLAMMYAETRNMTPYGDYGIADQTQNFEAVAQYQFDFGLRPSIAYYKSKAKDVEGIGDEDYINYIDVGATYYFNKNMSTYVDYQINQLKDDNKLGINNDDIVALGLVYQF